MDVAGGYYVLSTGARRSLAEKWSDGPANWAYFAGPQSRYALYVAADEPSAAPWQYWPMDGNMTVFGFGRELTCCRKYLTGPRRFTVGLTVNRGFDAMARTIESASEPRP